MASPATIKDKVFFATSDKGIYCFHVEDGSSIWKFETEDKIWSSPSLSEYDGIMFFGSLDSHIYGIDINTGRQSWKFPTVIPQYALLKPRGCLPLEIHHLGGFRKALTYLSLHHTLHLL